MIVKPVPIFTDIKPPVGSLITIGQRRSFWRRLKGIFTTGRLLPEQDLYEVTESHDTWCMIVPYNRYTDHSS